MRDISEGVDNPFPQERSRRKQIGKIGKIALVCFISGLLVLTVSATYITFFNEVNTTINVVQSVQMDGRDYDEPITHVIDDAMGGCRYCFEHNVKNNGCEPVDLVFTEEGSPDLDGIDVLYLLPESSCCYHELETLEMSVLDGAAQNDDFAVFVDGILVYTYPAVGEGENWISHTIDLTPFDIVCCGTHTIKIVCTAPQPWTHFNPYGQLGVDTIDLYCEGGIWCDGVDIGESISEIGHNLQCWGPIEPATNTGSWGGIDDCRATWFWTIGDILPPAESWSTADASWASVDLSCEECYESGGCPDCNTGTSVEFPIHLEQGESLDFCICYDLDVLIQKGIYSVQHDLIPVPTLQ